MGRPVSVSQQDTKDSKSTGFDPLPAGLYNVDIFDHEVKQYKNGVNAGKDYIALHLRISDGQKGANRRLFTNVGDFPRWAPKSGGDGKVNFQFFQFYKALGVEFDGVEGDVDLPDYEDLNGSKIAVKVKIVADDYAFKNALKDWQAAGAKGVEPEPGNFLKNEVAEFLPEIDQDDLPDVEESGDEFDL